MGEIGENCFFTICGVLTGVIKKRHMKVVDNKEFSTCVREKI